MSAIDWIFLTIIGLSALFGLMRGFVGVVASFIAWVLAAWTAFRFGGGIGVWLADGGSPSMGEAFFGYALSFAGVFAVVALLSMVIKRALHAAGLLGVDRMLGLAFGTARGIFIASAMVLLVSFTPLVQRASYRNSVLAPMLAPLAGAMREWLPTWAEARADVEADGRAQVRAPSGGVLGMPSPRDIRRQMQAGQQQPMARPPTSDEQAALERAVLPVLGQHVRAMRGQLGRGNAPAAAAPSARGATPASNDPASTDGADTGDAASIER